jgi:hypothetical protein
MIHSYQGFSAYIDACSDDPGLIGVPVSKAADLLNLKLKRVLEAIYLGHVDLVRVFTGQSQDGRIYIPLRSLSNFVARRAGRAVRVPEPSLYNWHRAFEELALRDMLDAEAASLGPQVAPLIPELE